jgi:hypothetical protein
MATNLLEVTTGGTWSPDTGFNTNALDPTQFKIIFSRLPGYVFFCQSITVPTMSLPEIDRASPMLNHSEVGERVEFGNLQMQMILDSKLDNYKALYRWMKDLSVLGKGSATTSGALLTLGNGNNIEFVNVWPTNIGAILFTSTPDIVQYALSEVEFGYDYFHFPDDPQLVLT